MNNYFLNGSIPFSVQQDLIKAENRAEIQLATVIRKNYLKEYEREVKKSQYEKIKILDDGRLSLETQNLRMNIPAREISNIRFPKLIKLVNASEPEKNCFVFLCVIKTESKEMYLDKEKIYNPNYFSKKLDSIGVEFYCTSRVKEKEMERKLLQKMFSENQEVKYVAPDIGWYQNENREIKFCEEDRETWKAIMKRLR